MNERIQALWEQAVQGDGPHASVIADFAELIVRDLIDSMIKRYGDDDDLPIQEIKFFVKEHFGVEQ